MSIFRSIGNAFKDGWNRSKNENTANDRTYRGYSPKKVDNYTTETADYANNIMTASFLSVDNPDNNNSLNDIDLSTSSKYDLTKQSFENNFKIPASILNDISKNYKFIYENTAKMVNDFGILESNPTYLSVNVIDMPVVPSMFNPLYGLNVIGITGNTPLIDSKNTPSGNSIDSDGKEFKINVGDYSLDIHDCSIKKLVQLSNENKMGREIYKYADFMYCKQLGKFSNNRLITLRRFPLPIGDDISKYSSAEKDGLPNIPGDVGRLVCWMDDDNKLEDILKYEYHETFVEKKAQYQDINSKEEEPARGSLGALLNLANPKYRKMVAGGWNSDNKILNSFVGSSRITEFLLDSKGTNRSDAPELLTRYDQNRIYEPKATIKETHLYEGTLEFSHTFSLVFDYELRAYENINPKTAFLDLLNNIYQVTYRQGAFWGGAIWFIGAPQNKEGWQTADALINKNFDALSNTFDMLLRGNLNIGDLFGNWANKLVSIVKEAAAPITSGEQSVADAAKNAGNKVADAINKYNVGDMIKGMFKNKLGRPGLYAANSILSGDPVGPWHVTIGNPRNPIMSIGNLIIESSTIQHYGPLGFDDFPTGLKVTINLKHGRPRDMIELGKMYTGGKSGIGVPLSRDVYSKYIDDNFVIRKSAYDANQFATMWASTNIGFTDGLKPAEEEAANKYNK